MQMCIYLFCNKASAGAVFIIHNNYNYNAIFDAFKLNVDTYYVSSGYCDNLFISICVHWDLVYL